MILLLRFAAILATFPISALALEWTNHNNFRVAQLPVPTTGKTGFTLLPPATTGITFTNFIAVERHLTNQILLNGSGVAAGDIDGDGWCDLYFCSTEGRNALYRNLGNWKFEDITAKAGVALPGPACPGIIDGQARAAAVLSLSKGLRWKEIVDIARRRPLRYFSLKRVKRG